MFSSDNGYSLADVAAVTNSGYGNNGGFGDGNGWWIILLFLFALGGWGNGRGFGGGYGGGSGTDTTGMLYPWMNQAGITTGGFENAAIQSSLGDITTSLCSGFAGVTAAVTASQNALAQQMYSNQLADLERSFAAQTANTAGLTNLSNQLAQCCCDNRLATAQLDATIARENCADREALNYSTRDIIANQTAGIQRILDQMSSDKIDAKNEKIADLERQLTMANLAASQIAQTAQIQSGQVAEVDALYQRLRDCPVPTMPVYGMQPIFTCPGNNRNYGCGCNNGNLFA